MKEQDSQNHVSKNDKGKNDMDWLKEQITQIQNDIQALIYILTNLVDPDEKKSETSSKFENQQNIREIKETVLKTYKLLKDKEISKEPLFDPSHPRKIQSQITFRDIQNSSDISLSDTSLNDAKLKTIDVVMDSSHKSQQDASNIKNTKKKKGSISIPFFK